MATTKTAPLLAFHGDPAVKAKYLRRVRAHAKADEIVKGQYWSDGKGCAVGCTIHGDSHKDYEVELGVPEMLARLEDSIFEGLPNGTAQTWPARFLKAAEPGADLSRVGWQFLHWLLTEEVAGRNHEAVKAAVSQCAAVLLPLMEGRPAAGAAARAAGAAARAAGAAAWAAGDAAWAAAWAAAGAAGDAARAAGAAARAAGDAAGAAGFVRMADKLIELMEAA